MRGVKSHQRIPGRKRDRICPDCASILVKGQERYKNKKIIPFPREEHYFCIGCGKEFIERKEKKKGFMGVSK